MKLFVFKKRRILCLLLGLFFVSAILVSCFSVRYVNSPKLNYRIVIDAGHGGIDGGAVGKRGTTESRINLDFAIELKNVCQQAGVQVVMTRESMDGLYSPLAQNKKRSEMEKREKIIRESGADLVVSIHQNSFPLSSLRGAQVFYKQGSESGKALASSVQKGLVEGDIKTRGEIAVGDFYVLNCTEKPAILVECGFLSNEEEEGLLCKEEYRKKFCELLFCGILEFYGI